MWKRKKRSFGKESSKLQITQKMGKEWITLTKKWRVFWRKGTHKHMETYLRNVCTFTLFWSRKTSVIVKISQIGFHVFVCAFSPEISSFFSKSFPIFLYGKWKFLKYVYQENGNKTGWLLPINSMEVPGKIVNTLKKQSTQQTRHCSNMESCIIWWNIHINTLWKNKEISWWKAHKNTQSLTDMFQQIKMPFSITRDKYILCVNSLDWCRLPWSQNVSFMMCHRFLDLSTVFLRPLFPQCV